MNERTRPPREREGGYSSLSELFDSGDSPPELVTVSSGPYLESLPVANMTVGEIRRRFRTRLDLDPESQAVLDGQDVGDDVVVRAGQSLMFARRSGEKGGVIGCGLGRIFHALGSLRNRCPQEIKENAGSGNLSGMKV